MNGVKGNDGIFSEQASLTNDFTRIMFCEENTRNWTMPMKVREMIRLVMQDGREFHSQRGGHRQCTNPVKKGRVTIPGKESANLARTGPKEASSSKAC